MKLFLILISAVLTSTTFLSAQEDKGRASLHSLSSVFVVIQPIASNASEDGLKTDHIRSLVEALLRQAGIPMAKEPQQKDGFANLIITIDTIKHSQGVYLFTVQVGVVQTVILTRNAKLGAVPSQTWEAMDLGLTTPQRLDIIDEPLKQKLGEFVTAFKAANGK